MSLEGYNSQGCQSWTRLSDQHFRPSNRWQQMFLQLCITCAFQRDGIQATVDWNSNSSAWNPGTLLVKGCSGHLPRSWRLVQKISTRSVETDFIIKTKNYLPFILSFSHECPEEFSRSYMNCATVTYWMEKQIESGCFSEARQSVHL